MGRRHQVDYPQVPQSHQLNEQPSTQYLNRYSWMDNNGDGDRRHHAQNVPKQSNSRAEPPSPIYESQHQEAVELPTPELSHGQWTKQREAQMNQEIYDTIPTQQQQQPPYHQHVHVPSAPTHTSDVKIPEKAVYSEKRSEKLSIGPDANPLSPRLPPDSLRNQRRNTNIGVMSPPVIDFASAAYQPISQPTRGGSWQHSLGSCAEPSICMTGLLCPCILYGRVQYRLSLRSEKKDASNMLGYEAINGSCIAWSLLCGVNGILSGIQKSRIRRSYEMVEGSGSCLGDCLQGCCCCCCVLAQNEKEMKHREEVARRMGANGQEGYVPPGGMTFTSQPQ